MHYFETICIVLTIVTKGIQQVKDDQGKIFALIDLLT